ncbi:MAG: site-specific integrase, partial [Gemmatimonadales bacterium]
MDPASPEALDPAFRLDQFGDYLALEAAGSRNTIEAYGRDVRRLATYAAGQGVAGPGDLTPTRLREFVYALKDVGLSPATIRRQISSARTYFRFLLGEGHITRDPSERLESPRGWRRLPTVLTFSEVERMLAAPNTDQPLAIRDRALLEFAYATGVRVSELVALTL